MDALWGEPGGGLLYWGPWRLCRGRLWWGASLFIGTPIGEPERGFMYRGLWETDEGYVEKALEKGISLDRGPPGEPGRGLIYQRLSEMDEGCSRSGAALSGGALWGEPGGETPLLGTLEDMKKRLWRWASLSVGALLGNLEGGSYIGDFERWMKEGCRDGASLSEEALWGEPGGRARLLGTLKDMLSKALEMDICFHRCPASGELGGWSFPVAFEGREKFLYIGKFLWGIWEICNKGLIYGQLYRGPVGEPGGGSFTGTFERKKGLHIWVPFSWTQRTLKVKCGGHLEL